MTDDERRIDSRAFGALEAAVKHLTDTWKEQDRSATDGRRELHRKFEELKDSVLEEIHGVKLEVGNLGHRLASVIDDVAQMRPQITISNNEHHERLGSRKALGKAWAALIGIVTAAGTVGAGIVELIQWLSPPKPPLH